MRYFYLLSLSFIALAACQSPQQKQSPSFTISFAQDTAFDGRLLLLISTDDSNEPRFQITDRPSTQQVFGMDVTGWQGRTPLSFGAEEYGYPIKSLADLPEGEYYVQALLHKYETFNLKTGHIVKLPMDRGEGQQWNRAPGNLYSKPQKISIKQNSRIEIALTEEIPPITPPEDSKYIKHIKIKSDLLSEFWGRDMYLGAHVLLPEGFDEHPEAKYPLAIMHGHFPADFGGFRSTPPDPDLKPEYSTRFKLEGYNKIVQEEEYKFYKDWTGPDFPRFLAIEIQHANPYYDDSYAVNSANLGPYGDAITYELIPHIEKTFRGIGEGWARVVYGGSTGGWEALAVQVKYPDEYGTCYAACPDPIDFRAYCLLNLYEDKNAYNLKGPFRMTKRPGHRDYLGNVDATLEDMNLRELALGTKSRSGQQFDIWEAVYSPQGDDGYPVRVWDKETGEINQEVLEYWRENYDLTHIMQRDWATLGPKLRGKINIYCGDMDNYYLNNAVYLAEEFLENAQPAYEGEVDYGDRAEHCWNGDHTQPNAISRLRYHQMFIPRFAERLEKTAPAGTPRTWIY